MDTRRTREDSDNEGEDPRRRPLEYADLDSQIDNNETGNKDLSRDKLLLRCRDAIESLHEELQEERMSKHQL